MSHLLLIQGPDSAVTLPLFRQASSLFQQVHGLRQYDSVTTPSAAIALFPRRMSTTPSGVKVAGGWICGVGSWFYEGLTDEAALARVAHTLESFDGTPDASFRELDGHFALLSQRTDDSLIVTDRLGELHVYIAHVNSCLVLSTSSIILSILCRSSWDPEGCRQFLSTGSILQPERTLFTGIEKLGSSSIFRFRSGRLTTRTKYWDIVSLMNGRHDEASDVLGVAAGLRAAMTVIRRNYRRPAVDLTGGFDTRGILGAVLQLGLDLDFVVSGSDESADVITSKRIAREFKLRHHHLGKRFATADQMVEPR